MCEAMNDIFQIAFTTEEAFVKTKIARVSRGSMKMEEMLVDQNELLTVMKALDVRKATEPVGIVGWILKECTRVRKTW